jgi:hypothetical protein
LLDVLAQKSWNRSAKEDGLHIYWLARIRFAAFGLFQMALLAMSQIQEALEQLVVELV